MKQSFLKLVFLVGLFTFCKPCFAQQYSAYGTQGTIAEKIVTNLNAGKYEDVRTNFTLTYKSQTPRELIAQSWEGILSLLGNFKSVVSVTKIKDTSANDVLKVRCQLEKENINVEITFNVDNKVIFLRFQQ